MSRRVLDGGRTASVPSCVAPPAAIATTLTSPTTARPSPNARAALPRTRPSYTTTPGSSLGNVPAERSLSQ